MDPLLQFISWQFMLFSLLIGGIVFFLRLTFETFIKNLKDNFYWTEYVLVVLPLLLGGSLGFLVKSYPYPDGLSSNWSRVIFGFVAGQFSGWLYRVVKSMLSQKIASIASDIPGAQPAPPVNPAAPPPPTPSA